MGCNHQDPSLWVDHALACGVYVNESNPQFYTTKASEMLYTFHTIIVFMTQTTAFITLCAVPYAYNRLQKS